MNADTLLNWTPVRDRSRFVDPALMSRLKRGDVDATVTEDGTLDVDEHGPTSLTPTDRLEPGTRVRVKFTGGNLFTRPTHELEMEHRRVQAARETARVRDERREARLKDLKRYHARLWWARYDIPFAHDVARKGHRNELGRGSTGTGVTERTVNHLWVLEPFKDGRLEREQGRWFLCDGYAEYPYTEIREQDGSGEDYAPPVTCSACLDLMERWKVETEGDS